MIESVRYADRVVFFELTLSAPQQRNAIGMREVQGLTRSNIAATNRTALPTRKSERRGTIEAAARD